jgi:hypothetical protein
VVAKASGEWLQRVILCFDPASCQRPPFRDSLMLENNFLNMSDRIGPLLPAALDPAMSSCTSLNSMVSLASITTNEDGESHKPTKERWGGLVDRRKKTNNESRHRVMGSYKDAGPLRRKASTAPTAWPRDPETGKSNRDSLEMSLGARLP